MSIHPLRKSFNLLALVIGFSSLTAVQSPRETRASLTEDGARFELVGETTFKWLSMLKVYDARLHLGAGENPSRVFSDVPVRLQLVYHRGFTAAEIIKGGDALLARNVSATDLSALRDRLEILNKAYKDVRPGDDYVLTYVPGKGTTLRLNGSPLVTVPGRDFASAYFRIWLGDDPISAPMRDSLLGR